MEARERLVASVLGAMVGDALGLPHEGHSPHRAWRLFPGEMRPRLLFGRMMVSDDGEHALMTAAAVGALHADDPVFRDETVARGEEDRFPALAAMAPDWPLDFVSEVGPLGFGLIQAAARVHAFQFSVLSDEDGKREAFSIVGADGRVTMRGPEGALMRFEPGGMSLYDANEKKIVRFKFGGVPGMDDMAKSMAQGMDEGVKEMNLQKMLAEYRQKYGERGITISPTTREDGESVYHVTLAAPDEPQRVEMTVDSATDLPERLRVTSKDGGKVAVEIPCASARRSIRAFWRPTS